MLKLENIVTCYGSIEALKGISLEVQQGQIVTLLGANGAGKTTTLKTISGLLIPTKGSIEFEGQKIVGLPAEKIVVLGIAQVPEGREVFPALTVQDNLEIGAFIRKDKTGIIKDIDLIYGTFPRLSERRKQLGGTLSGGEQQMLAIGRALMARPKLILFDEPSLGLAPLIVSEIFRIIKELNERGVTILLVEQNTRMALSISHYGYIIETSKIILSDKPEKLINNDLIRKAYLGI